MPTPDGPVPHYVGPGPAGTESAPVLTHRATTTPFWGSLKLPSPHLASTEKVSLRGRWFL